jgi:hypothetical protein
MGNADGPTFVARGGNFSCVSRLLCCRGLRRATDRLAATTHPLAAAMEFSRSGEIRLKIKPKPKSN